MVRVVLAGFIQQDLEKPQIQMVQVQEVGSRFIQTPLIGAFLRILVIMILITYMLLLIAQGFMISLYQEGPMDIILIG